MISSWKKQLLDTAPELFEDGRRKRKEDRETNENELYEQIGRLKMEVDWLKKKLTTFAKHKCKLIDPMHETISVRRQCELLDLNRSSYYFEPVGDSPENLKLMRRIDEMHLEWPFLGSRMIGKNLDIGRHRARRLMRKMGIEAIYPKPRTTLGNKQHEVYPYLLRDLETVRCDQVWSTDITYVPLSQGYMYLMRRGHRPTQLGNVSLDTESPRCPQAAQRALTYTRNAICETDFYPRTEYGQQPILSTSRIAGTTIPGVQLMRIV